MGFLLSSLCFLTISTVNVQIYQIDTFKIQLISICSFQGTFLLTEVYQSSGNSMCLASLITGKNQFINSTSLLDRVNTSVFAGFAFPSAHWDMSVLCKTLPGLFLWVTWHPPALPYRLQHSTIGRSCLNRRVRDGNGCFP